MASSGQEGSVRRLWPEPRGGQASRKGQGRVGAREAETKSLWETWQVCGTHEHPKGG